MGGAARTVRASNARAIVQALRERGPDAEPIRAVELAMRLNLVGQRESMRRRIREAVDYARENLGERICASDQSGYWLARDATEWNDFLQAMRTRGRFKFVAARRCQEAVTDAMSEQGKLFDASPVRTF